MQAHACTHKHTHVYTHTHQKHSFRQEISAAFEAASVHPRSWAPGVPLKAGPGSPSSVLRSPSRGSGGAAVCGVLLGPFCLRSSGGAFAW